MSKKTVKIYDDEKMIYEGSLTGNTCLLKGRLYKDPQTQGKAVHFSLQISNGKNPETNQWNNPTYADCSAFGDLSKAILERYREKDNIWIIGKFYSKSHNGRIYKGFVIKGVINLKPETSDTPDSNNFIGTEDVPF